jgi:hypothetical protein
MMSTFTLTGTVRASMTVTAAPLLEVSETDMIDGSQPQPAESLLAVSRCRCD